MRVKFVDRDLHVATELFDIQLAKVIGAAGEILQSALAEGLGTDTIVTGVMVHGGSDLYQSLNEELVGRKSDAPEVFPDFVGIEVLLRIEELLAARQQTLRVGGRSRGIVEGGHWTTLSKFDR